MITFHKHNNDCLECHETETALKNMVVAHNVKPLHNTEKDLPMIIEGKININGHKAIKNYIRDLEKTMELWQKFQGDSCYTGPDGKIC